MEPTVKGDLEAPYQVIGPVSPVTRPVHCTNRHRQPLSTLTSLRSIVVSYTGTPDRAFGYDSIAYTTTRNVSVEGERYKARALECGHHFESGALEKDILVSHSIKIELQECGNTQGERMF